MPDEFVPLEQFLRPIAAETQSNDAPPAERHDEASAVRYAEEESLRAARLFRAGLADALDAAVEELLRHIALEVMARELQLDPPCIARIVTRALEGHAAQNVLAIRANPADFEALADLGLERIADGLLRRGDVVIELRSGTIDCTLKARLDAAVAASRT